MALCSVGRMAMWLGHRSGIPKVMGSSLGMALLFALKIFATFFASFRFRKFSLRSISKIFAKFVCFFSRSFQQGCGAGAKAHFGQVGAGAGSRSRKPEPGAGAGSREPESDIRLWLRPNTHHPHHPNTPPPTTSHPPTTPPSHHPTRFHLKWNKVRKKIFLCEIAKIILIPFRFCFATSENARTP